MKSLDYPWYTSSDQLALLSNDIHIWRVSLKQPELYIQQLTKTLSRDEIMRADRFHFKRDRRRFTVGRGILRAILGLYTETDPAKLLFRYGSYGKPYLGDRFCEDNIQFSLSHSDELALYAFALDSEVGIDLEHIRDMVDFEQIAAAFFSSRESYMLNALPENQRKEAFFNCWTRKEAFIKAIGNGLAYALDKFVVSVNPEEPARLLSIEGDEKADSWSLTTLTPEPGYAASLAVKGHNWSLICRQFA